MLTKAEMKFIEKVASPVRRKNRTVSLDDAQYETFQRLCYENGWQTNKVLDALIGLFIESNEK